jgi:hypothetical protein
LGRTNYKPDKIKILYPQYILRNMTCEALVIGSVAGLALTAGVLSFQALADRKAARKQERKKIVANSIIAKTR